MKISLKFLFAAQIGSALFLGALVMPAMAQPQPNAAERAAALKATMAASQTVLKHYEWVENVVISIKDEEKSHQMNRCYFGADGGVQKIPLTTPPPVEKKRGLRGRIIENKREEMTDYMKSAVALVKSYVPPSPALIQAAKDHGNVSVDIIEPGKRARLNFRNYLKPQDNLSVEFDLTTNHLLRMTVKSHLESVEDAVNLEARFGSLADGTTYTETVTLDAPAKNIRVKIDNSGYRKSGN
jgi:hypothetical protein